MPANFPLRNRNVQVAVLACAEETKLESSDGLEQDEQSHDVDKRYLAALAKSGRLPKYLISQKRVQDSGEENSNVETPQDHSIAELSDAWQNEKRHIGSFLKSHGKPIFFKPRNNREMSLASTSSFTEKEDASHESPGDFTEGGYQKRNVASLARLGRLNAVRYASFAPRYGGGSKRVYFYDDVQNDGNSLEEEAEDVANCEEEDDGYEGSNNSQDNHVSSNWTQKRYIAALARSGRLPIWHTQRSWWGGKRDRPVPFWMTYRSGARAYGNKRLNMSDNDLASKTKSKRCKRSQDVFSEDKRNLAMLARKGLLPNRPYVSA